MQKRITRTNFLTREMHQLVLGCSGATDFANER